MREKANDQGVDLLLVDTGDRIEGNGLYDASDPKGKYTADIFKQQTIDVICSGNHELYHQSSSENEYKKTVPNFKGNYLASNLDIYDPETGDRVPLAQRHKKFTTKNQGIRILAFGFLYDFTGNANNTVVQPVGETIHEKWFQEAIRDREVDLFLVIGHVAVRSEEYAKLFKAIREVQWDTPIQFFGGHTHIRDYKKYDNKAYALESGRYMETIGFQSISGLNTGGKEQLLQPAIASPSFARRYIDNNLYSFHHHTALNSTTFPTPHGRNVSSLITSARKTLKLDSQFGCAPTDLWTNRVPYPSENSIFSWLEQFVLPNMVLDTQRGDKPRIVIANTGAMRFDIFQGPFSKDTTFTVCPFTSGFRYIKDVPFEVADRLLAVLNNAGQIFKGDNPEIESRILAPPQQIDILHDLLPSDEFQISNTYQSPLVHKPSLIPGYTTHDDAGSDGDDTIHSPITFYHVPNCIEARINVPSKIPAPSLPSPNPSPPSSSKEEDPANPETVDLVYLEFIQPWILLATRFLGKTYVEGDTEPYMDGEDFTGLIAKWVEDNWKGEC